MNYSHRKIKEEEGRMITAVDAFQVAEKSNKKLKVRLQEEEKERKSATVALDTVERQAKSQRLLLRNTEDQLAASKEQIVALKKLEEVKMAKAQATTPQPYALQASRALRPLQCPRRKLKIKAAHLKLLLRLILLPRRQSKPRIQLRQGTLTKK